MSASANWSGLAAAVPAAQSARTGARRSRGSATDRASTRSASRPGRCHRAAALAHLPGIEGGCEKAAPKCPLRTRGANVAGRHRCPCTIVLCADRPLSWPASPWRSSGRENERGGGRLVAHRPVRGAIAVVAGVLYVIVRLRRVPPDPPAPLKGTVVHGPGVRRVERDAWRRNLSAERRDYLIRRYAIRRIAVPAVVVSFVASLGYALLT